MKKKQKIDFDSLATHQKLDYLNRGIIKNKILFTCTKLLTGIKINARHIADVENRKNIHIIHTREQMTTTITRRSKHKVYRIEAIVEQSM